MNSLRTCLASVLLAVLLTGSIASQDGTGGARSLLKARRPSRPVRTRTLPAVGGNYIAPSYTDGSVDQTLTQTALASGKWAGGLAENVGVQGADTTVAGPAITSRGGRAANRIAKSLVDGSVEQDLNQLAIADGGKAGGVASNLGQQGASTNVSGPSISSANSKGRGNRGGRRNRGGRNAKKSGSSSSSSSSGSDSDGRKSKKGTKKHH